MANATSRDARAGFAIYLQSSDGIQLDELNTRLERSSYGPVAQRTLNHYRNLVKAGFSRYISINRFDVARASQAYGNMSSLGRYRYRSVQHNVSAIFMKNNRLLQVNGRTVEAGDVGAIIEFAEPEIMKQLQRLNPTPSDDILLHYSDRSDAIKGRVVDADLKSAPLVIEVEYASLTSLVGIDAATLLPTSTIQFRLVPDDDSIVALDTLGRRLHHLFSLIEAVRALHNEAGRYSKDHPYASPPLVTHMQLSSPAILLLQLAPEVIQLLSWSLLGGLLSIGLRKQWHQGTVNKSQAELLSAEAKLREFELERSSLEQKLRVDMLENVRRQLPSSTLTNEQLERIIIAYVVPSLRALSQASLQAVDVDIAEDGPNGKSAIDLDGPKGEEN